MRFDLAVREIILTVYIIAVHQDTLYRLKEPIARLRLVTIDKFIFDTFIQTVTGLKNLAHFWNWYQVDRGRDWYHMISSTVPKAWWSREHWNRQISALDWVAGLNTQRWLRDHLEFHYKLNVTQWSSSDTPKKTLKRSGLEKKQALFTYISFVPSFRVQVELNSFLQGLYLNDLVSLDGSSSAFQLSVWSL